MFGLFGGMGMGMPGMMGGAMLPKFPMGMGMGGGMLPKMPIGGAGGMGAPMGALGAGLKPPIGPGMGPMAGAGGAAGAMKPPMMGAMSGGGVPGGGAGPMPPGGGITPPPPVGATMPAGVRPMAPPAGVAQPQMPQGAGLQSMPSAQPALPPKFNPAPADYNNLVNTVAHEAGNQGPMGQQAVANVAFKRQEMSPPGTTISQVVQQPRQFSPWNNRTSLPPVSPQKFQQVAQNIQPAQYGMDVTDAATHFANTKISTPGGWEHTNKPHMNIGAHSFYKDIGAFPGQARGAVNSGPVSPQMVATVPGMPQGVPQTQMAAAAPQVAPPPPIQARPPMQASAGGMPGLPQRNPQASPTPASGMVSPSMHPPQMMPPTVPSPAPNYLPQHINKPIPPMQWPPQQMARPIPVPPPQGGGMPPGMQNVPSSSLPAMPPLRSGLNAMPFNGGQQMRPPQAAPMSMPTPNPQRGQMSMPTPNPSRGQPSSYSLKKGENPWQISQRLGIPLERLMKINKLTEQSSRRLPIGYQMQLPRGY
jgi:hypothetical protein